MRPVPFSGTKACRLQMDWRKIFGRMMLNAGHLAPRARHP
jgi:hypothetical protein